MEAVIQKASVLVEALPYIRKFEGKTVVIKYGGSAMTDPRIRKSTAEDVVLMKYVGMNPIVVHGGGPAINGMLKRLAIESKFHQGRRVTDDAAIEVVEMILAGTVNKDIVTLLNQAGGQAVGLSGKDANLLHARKIEFEDGADIGHVGQIVNVHTRILNVLCAAGMIPVVAPLATDAEGGTWNINADTAAGEVAAALQAEKLVFLTDTPGVLRDKDDPDSLIHHLRHGEVAQLTREGIIAGGMIPKVDACIKALDYGVSRTHIIDGRVPHALLLEIFTDKGVGTLVTL
ncbi:MAG TPA: acetylglutamate kinase [Candidatus Hydrogenedentes bacterium]|nr:acetylglutamate kinase [Candidatus Hydrogenedentota bacterium]HRT21697.1 acetylglutamate kinase [Candidatus Hydrogenedentota bacterium]HRT66538.1 acetylglutamate kinase [Candidatus Hydrogenedentota bacterium]